MTTLLMALLGSLGTGVASGFSGWLYGKRGQKVSNDSTEIDNLEKVVRIWRQLSADLKAEIIAMRSELTEMKSENLALRKENEALKTQVGKLKSQLDKFIKKYGDENGEEKH